MSDITLPITRRLEKARAKMVAELNQDPAPRFSITDIRNTTAWLRTSSEAMKEASNSFSVHGLELLIDEELQKHIEVARKSCHHLSMLCGDRTSSFGGDQARGTIEAVRRSKQSQEIKTKLREFSSFLQSLGNCEWLGETVGPSFKKHKKVVVDLLGQLQAPAKRTHAPIENYSDMTIANDNDSCEEQYLALATMADEFAASCRDVAAKHVKKMTMLTEKIDALKEFVVVLNEIPDDVRQFVLLRAGTITEYRQLKPYVNEKETTAVLQQLEKFREDAIVEKTMRRVNARLNSSQREASRSPRRHSS